MATIPKVSKLFSQSNTLSYMVFQTDEAQGKCQASQWSRLSIETTTFPTIIAVSEDCTSQLVQPSSFSFLHLTSQRRSPLASSTGKLDGMACQVEEVDVPLIGLLSGRSVQESRPPGFSQRGGTYEVIRSVKLGDIGFVSNKEV